MTYLEYKARFDQRHQRFRVQTGATQCGPFLRPTSAAPDLPPWKLFWCIIYPDGKYVRIVEYYEPDSRSGQGHGKRVAFVLHYGQRSGVQDDLGCPRRSSATDIRFDLATDQHADHLHYQGETHIPQNRVQGLKIKSLDPFAFIEQIEHHRRSGEALHLCFGFTVIAP